MNLLRLPTDQPSASHSKELSMTTPDTPSSPPSQAATPLGQLADDTPDVMTLHTQDAYRMFTGRSGDSESDSPAIPGGRRLEPSPTPGTRPTSSSALCSLIGLTFRVRHRDDALVGTRHHRFATRRSRSHRSSETTPVSA